jgi:quercetin dioxygenase-like cupin family protein
MKLVKALVVAAATVPLIAFAQDSPLPEGFTTEPVIKSTTNRDGEEITLPTGRVEITSVIGTLEPNGQTPLHQHPVPVYVYVLEGEVELRTEGDEPQRYAAGEAWIESQGTLHQAHNVADAPARVLIVIIGEEGQPATITPEN